MTGYAPSLSKDFKEGMRVWCMELELCSILRKEHYLTVRADKIVTMVRYTSIIPRNTKDVH